MAMTTFEEQDYHDILQFACLCNSHLEPKSLQKEILHELQRMFHAESGVFSLSPQQDKAEYVSLNTNHYYDFLYERFYWRHNPLLTYALHSKCNVFKSDDLFSKEEWFKLTFYNEFLYFDTVTDTMVSLL